MATAHSSVRSAATLTIPLRSVPNVSAKRAQRQQTVCSVGIGAVQYMTGDAQFDRIYTQRSSCQFRRESPRRWGNHRTVYLDGFAVGGQHFLRQLHHLQGHVRDGFGVAVHLLVKPPRHAVGVPDRLDLCRGQSRSGRRLFASSRQSKPKETSGIQRRIPGATGFRSFHGESRKCSLVKAYFPFCHGSEESLRPACQASEGAPVSIRV